MFSFIFIAYLVKVGLGISAVSWIILDVVVVATIRSGAFGQHSKAENWRKGF